MPQSPPPPRSSRPRLAAISSRTTRRSRCGRRRRSPRGAAGARAPPVAGVPLGLYLHIPFCRKRCHFCYFRVYTDRNAREVESYLDLLGARVGAVCADWRRSPAGRSTSSTSAAARRRFSRPRSSRGWSTRLTAATPWTSAEEITFECEPGTLTEAEAGGDPRAWA